MIKTFSNKELDEMIKNVHGRVYRHIFYKSEFDKELAEDICHRAYEKMIIRIREGKYEEQDKFEAWAMIIAKNLLTDHFRKAQRFQDISKGPIDFDTFAEYHEKAQHHAWDVNSIDEVDTGDRITKILRDQIKKLKPEQALILDLVFFKGYPYKQIAEEYNMSINTALGRMRYALINLRKLNDEHPELKELVLK